MQFADVVRHLPEIGTQFCKQAKHRHDYKPSIGTTATHDRPACTRAPGPCRLDSCSSSGCISSPAEVTILCGDGSTASSATPAPVSVTSSSCGIIEIAGTSGAASDGFYYDEGDLADGVTQYQGYDEVNGELTRCCLVPGLHCVMGCVCPPPTPSGRYCLCRVLGEYIHASIAGASNNQHQADP